LQWTLAGTFRVAEDTALVNVSQSELMSPELSTLNAPWTCFNAGSWKVEKFPVASRAPSIVASFGKPFTESKSVLFSICRPPVVVNAPMLIPLREGLPSIAMPDMTEVNFGMEMLVKKFSRNCKVPLTVCNAGIERVVVFLICRLPAVVRLGRMTLNF